MVRRESGNRPATMENQMENDMETEFTGVILG